jgi:aspartate carbamoyltransferase catalytic subunit
LPPAGETDGVATSTDLDEGIGGVDVVMMLRIQRERLEESASACLEDYQARWCLTRDRLERAAPEALVMHPGPINRGTEIAGDVADDPQRSLILEQVELGVAVRMACLDVLTRARRG